MKNLIVKDKIVFSPNDLNEDIKPLQEDIDNETEIIGTFNPGMTTLLNGNILLMIRVAEAIKNYELDDYILTPRFDANKNKFIVDKYPSETIKIKDPRLFELQQENKTTALRLTSISWLLPVEINPENLNIDKIHYDKKILPSRTIEEMGIEDPRITLIDNIYYMTVVCVSSNKICTSLYASLDGVKYDYKGLIFEHQNKDIVLFPEKINKKYYALTRPEGSNLSIGYPRESQFFSGPFINIASSPDLYHWKPHECIFKPLEKNSLFNSRIGPGSPPILYENNKKSYFLELFHGVGQVEKKEIGKYRTFSMLIDRKNPEKIIKVSKKPILEHNTKLKEDIKSKLLFEKDIVFTTGIVENDHYYIIASGELDTATRLTIVDKHFFDYFF